MKAETVWCRYSPQEFAGLAVIYWHHIVRTHRSVVDLPILDDVFANIIRQAIPLTLSVMIHVSSLSDSRLTRGDWAQ